MVTDDSRPDNAGGGSNGINTAADAIPAIESDGCIVADCAVGDIRRR